MAGHGGDLSLSILASVAVVCNSDARLEGLNHVGLLISSYLDFSTYWSLHRASCHVLPYLLHHLASSASSASYIDALCDQLHAFAARRGLQPEMAILDTLFPTLIISEAVTAAAETGHVAILSWLYARQAPVCWRNDIALVAARSGNSAAVHFLLQRFPPTTPYILYQILRVSVSRGLDDITDVIWPQFVLMEPLPIALNEILSCAPKRVATRMLRNDLAATYSISIDEASLKGDISFVIWAHSHGAVGTTKAMDSAATYGHFELLQWLHLVRLDGCTTDAMDGAAAHGHFNIVRWLHGNRSEGCTDRAFFVAAFRGHLDIIQWLFRNRHEGFPSSTFDHVCANGHLEIARWLTDRRLGGGSTSAMDWAAAQNHLQVLEWLHENRPEGCTFLAMDNAASNGHLRVVHWLNEHRAEGCTTDAMDYAAGNGHIAVLRYLDSSGLGSFTTAAMDNAAAGGRLDVVQWLHAHENEVGCTTAAMDNAAASGHREIVLWLHVNRTEGGTTRGVDAAANNGDIQLLEFFRDNGYEQVSPSAFQLCVARGDLHTARWIAVHCAAMVDMHAVVTYARPNGWTSSIVAAAF